MTESHGSLYNHKDTGTEKKGEGFLCIELALQVVVLEVSHQSNNQYFVPLCLIRFPQVFNRWRGESGKAPRRQR